MDLVKLAKSWLGRFQNHYEAFFRIGVVAELVAVHKSTLSLGSNRLFAIATIGIFLHLHSGHSFIC